MTVAPRVDGDRCVHARSEVASCHACVRACPRGAWALDDAALSFDEAACDGCGLCAPACPEGAIAHHWPVAWSVNGSDVLAACERSGRSGGPGVVACLHAAGLGELLRLYRGGARRLVVAHGPCDECPRGSARSVVDTLQALNAALAARDLRPLSLEAVPAAEWETARAAAAATTSAPPLGRRGFLRGCVGRVVQHGFETVALAGSTGPRWEPPGRLLAQTQRPGPLPYVPRIDPERCSACDACVRLCAHDAIALTVAPEASAYDLHPESCSGCGVCRDVCAGAAIAIDAWAVPTQRRVELDGARCRACGVTFRMPRGRRLPGALCPVCARVDHARSLFQVLR